MMTPPMLHCSRKAESNDEVRQAASNIAERVLQAFEFSLKRSDGITPCWLLPTCRTATNGSAVTNWVAFPDDHGDSFSIHVQCCTEHAVLESIAAAEIAFQWRQAGLIDQYCDRFRWGRHLYDDEYRPRIEAAMQALELPYTDSTTSEFQDGTDEINPDPAGVAIAAKLAHQLSSFDASVVLFGSRATGKHHVGSDIDLMVFYDIENDDAPPDDEEPFPKLRRTISSFLLEQQQKGPRIDVDVNIVEQSSKEFYFHHSQNLQQPQPNGLLFAKACNVPGREQNFGLQTRNYRPDLDAYPVHFTSTELWVVKVLEDSQGSFGKLDTVDMPPCKACR